MSRWLDAMAIDAYVFTHMFYRTVHVHAYIFSVLKMAFFCIDSTLYAVFIKTSVVLLGAIVLKGSP